jgi:hypothetical protein
MSVADENDLRVFERKTVRRIYGPVREGERWRIRSNRELEEILEGEDCEICEVPTAGLVRTCEADGGGKDVKEAVAWENGGKETWKAKEELVT